MHDGQFSVVPPADSASFMIRVLALQAALTPNKIIRECEREMVGIPPRAGALKLRVPTRSKIELHVRLGALEPGSAATEIVPALSGNFLGVRALCNVCTQQGFNPNR